IPLEHDRARHADDPGAEDDRVIAGLGIEDLDPAGADHERLEQHGRAKRQVVVDRQEAIADLTLWDLRVGRETAGGRDPPRIAESLVGVDEDAVADLEAFDVLAELDDLA